MRTNQESFIRTQLIIILLVLLVFLSGCFTRYDWSPDGKGLAAFHGRSLYIVRPDDRTAEAVYTEQEENYHIGYVRFLDNDNVLFFRFYESEKLINEPSEDNTPPAELLSINLSSLKTKVLTKIDIQQGAPPFMAWAGLTISPDRKSVIFVHEGEKSLMRLDLETGRVHDLNVKALKPAFSPDGSVLSAVASEGKGSRIMILTPEGRVIRERSYEGLDARFCETVWDKDGKGFFTCVQREGDAVIWVSAEDLSIKNILKSSEGEPLVKKSFMNLQPDSTGNSLYISFKEGITFTGVLRHSLEDGRSEKLFSHGYRKNTVDIPTESPDGRWIALTMHTESGFPVGIYSLPDLKPLDLKVQFPDGKIKSIKGTPAVTVSNMKVRSEIDESPVEFPLLSRKEIDESFTWDAGIVRYGEVSEGKEIIVHLKATAFKNWKASNVVLKVDSVMGKSGDIIDRSHRSFANDGWRVPVCQFGVDREYKIKTTSSDVPEIESISGTLYIDIPRKIRVHSVDLSDDIKEGQLEISGLRAMFALQDSESLTVSIPSSLYDRGRFRTLNIKGDDHVLYVADPVGEEISYTMNFMPPIAKVQFLEAIDVIRKVIKFKATAK